MSAFDRRCETCRHFRVWPEGEINNVTITLVGSINPDGTCNWPWPEIAWPYWARPESRPSPAAVAKFGGLACQAWQAIEETPCRA